MPTANSLTIKNIPYESMNRKLTSIEKKIR